MSTCQAEKNSIPARGIQELLSPLGTAIVGTLVPCRQAPAAVATAYFNLSSHFVRLFPLYPRATSSSRCKFPVEPFLQHPAAQPRLRVRFRAQGEHTRQAYETLPTARKPIKDPAGAAAALRPSPSSFPPTLGAKQVCFKWFWRSQCSFPPIIGRGPGCLNCCCRVSASAQEGSGRSALRAINHGYCTVSSSAARCVGVGVGIGTRLRILE
jgi:hypothetical protein